MFTAHAHHFRLLLKLSPFTRGLQVAEALIKNGADVTKRDKDNNNALDLAINNGHKSVAIATLCMKHLHEFESTIQY